MPKTNQVGETCHILDFSLPFMVRWKKVINPSSCLPELKLLQQLMKCLLMCGGIGMF